MGRQSRGYDGPNRVLREGMTRRLSDPRLAAEAAFKKTTTKPVEPAPKTQSIPGAKELVSLRIDQDVLTHFQEGGSGWQERINDALRKAAGI
jgi:uncharacterized protein (DUF4415 family)